MIIRCETNNDYNRFYLSDINTMKELKEYADKNIPIECYMLDSRHKWNIYIEEDMRLVHLYLNNYLQYYEIDGYIYKQNKYDKIYDNYCIKCSHNESGWNCRYIKHNDGCKNYEQKVISRLLKYFGFK